MIMIQETEFFNISSFLVLFDRIPVKIRQVIVKLSSY